MTKTAIIKAPFPLAFRIGRSRKVIELLLMVVPVVSTQHKVLSNFFSQRKQTIEEVNLGRVSLVQAPFSVGVSVLKEATS